MGAPTQRVAHRALYTAQHAADDLPLLMPVPAPRDYTEEHQIQLAMQGLLVAEELPTKTRERLFTELHSFGWTDLEMAEHTRTTPYTTARIRDRLGLRPNRPRAEGMTA